MKLFFAANLLMLTTQALAQQYMDTNDPREIKSLLSKDNELNGFGGADLKVSDFAGERTLVVGAYGGLLINRSYMFGLAGYGLATSVEFDGVIPGSQEVKKLNLYGGYAGVLIGGTIATRELIHLNIPILLGAGGMQVTDENFFQNDLDTDFTIEQSAFFVVEPAAELEFNITTGLRLAAGSSYRWIRGSDLNNLSDEDLSGWSVMFSVRFGRF
ncbi:MAG: hypothetical protein KI790_21365 [Cyclobacteriaceae bacterium]|nr:hypothetical protein [Cyclobacteriaceae bacterium HetDA_MAG_MS6]